MFFKLATIISLVYILAVSPVFAMSQHQTLNQIRYNVRVNQTYAWKITGEGNDINDDISFRAEIKVNITQLNSIDYSITMRLLSGSYPRGFPSDGAYGGWLWDNEVWDLPNTPGTFNELIYPIDIAYWNSQFGVSRDSNNDYVLVNNDQIAIFVGGFIEYTGSVIDTYTVDSETGILQNFRHEAELTSRVDEDETYELLFGLEYKGSQVNDEDVPLIDIMNVTFTSNKINLISTISWGIIVLSLVGVITLNIRYFLGRDKNQ